MALRSISCVAPGSTMLLGEYAVLFNEPAIVCALNRYMKVTLTPRQDTQFTINSALGYVCGDIRHVDIEPPFEFVLSAIQSIKHLKQGFHLNIEAQFTDTLGFGSSAAVTVASVAVLLRYSQTIFTPLELLQRCRQIIRNVQGNGSGADVAATVFGGVVAYQAEPLQIKRLNSLPPIHLLYSGSKARTKKVIRHIIAETQHNTALQHLFKRCGKTVNLAIKAIEQQRWSSLGKMMNLYHDIQKLLGTCTPTLEQLIQQSRQKADIYGAKISGAGFGDCAIALGELNENSFPSNRWQKSKGVKQFSIGIAQNGFEISEQKELW